MTDPDRSASPSATARPDRWARILSAIAVAVAVIGLVAVVVNDDDGDPDPVAAERSTTTTEVDDQLADGGGDDTTTTTVDPLATTTTSLDPSTTTTSTTAPPAAGTCRNSRESQFEGRGVPSSCGPLRWDPAPRNQPAEITIDGQGEVFGGAPAIFTITWSDADAPVGDVSITGLGPDCRGECTPVAAPACTDKAVGPWDTPKGSPGSGSTTISVDGLAPGTYPWTAVVRTRSADGPPACLPDPYASEISASGVLVVR